MVIQASNKRYTYRTDRQNQLRRKWHRDQLRMKKKIDATRRLYRFLTHCDQMLRGLQGWGGL